MRSRRSNVLALAAYHSCFTDIQKGTVYFVAARRRMLKREPRKRIEPDADTEEVAQTGTANSGGLWSTLFSWFSADGTTATEEVVKNAEKDVKVPQEAAAVESAQDEQRPEDTMPSFIQLQEKQAQTAEHAQSKPSLEARGVQTAEVVGGTYPPGGGATSTSTRDSGKQGETGGGVPSSKSAVQLRQAAEETKAETRRQSPGGRETQNKAPSFVEAGATGATSTLSIQERAAQSSRVTASAVKNTNEVAHGAQEGKPMDRAAQIADTEIFTLRDTSMQVQDQDEVPNAARSPRTTSEDPSKTEEASTQGEHASRAEQTAADSSAIQLRQARAEEDAKLKSRMEARGAKTEQELSSALPAVAAQRSGVSPVTVAGTAKETASDLLHSSSEIKPRQVAEETKSGARRQKQEGTETQEKPSLDTGSTATGTTSTFSTQEGAAQSPSATTSAVTNTNQVLHGARGGKPTISAAQLADAEIFFPRDPAKPYQGEVLDPARSPRTTSEDLSEKEEESVLGDNGSRAEQIATDSSAMQLRQAQAEEDAKLKSRMEKRGAKTEQELSAALQPAAPAQQESGFTPAGARDSDKQGETGRDVKAQSSTAFQLQQAEAGRETVDARHLVAAQQGGQKTQEKRPASLTGVMDQTSGGSVPQKDVELLSSAAGDISGVAEGNNDQANHAGSGGVAARSRAAQIADDEAFLSFEAAKQDELHEAALALPDTSDESDRYEEKRAKPAPVSATDPVVAASRPPVSQTEDQDSHAGRRARSSSQQSASAPARSVAKPRRQSGGRGRAGVSPKKDEDDESLLSISRPVSAEAEPSSSPAGAIEIKADTSPTSMGSTIFEILTSDRFPAKDTEDRDQRDALSYFAGQDPKLKTDIESNWVQELRLAYLGVVVDQSNGPRKKVTRLIRDMLKQGEADTSKPGPVLERDAAALMKELVEVMEDRPAPVFVSKKHADKDELRHYFVAASAVSQQPFAGDHRLMPLANFLRMTGANPQSVLDDGGRLS
ncbi:unnamed protein product [Amoebophrya sp. A120]|nr:unnamed protein product [Amoebophrya sp. A120]|eukprot:GSA120T00018915001.1